jgi:hypothetical protein
VAAKSEVDGRTYFNVMVLQQQQCVDIARLLPLVSRVGGDAKVSLGDWGSWIRSTAPQATNEEGGRSESSDTSQLPALHRRIWRYWLERCAMALDHGPPTGLYNHSVRRRFKVFMGDPVVP